MRRLGQAPAASEDAADQRVVDAELAALAVDPLLRRAGPAVDLLRVAGVGVHEDQLADVVQERRDHQAVAMLVADLGGDPVGGALGGDAMEAEPPSGSASMASPPSAPPTGSHRGRLRASRPPDGHVCAARHRQARPHACLPRLPAAGPRRARTPEERIHRERRELGVDHVCFARRWGLPKGVASVIERHHADDATGEAAFVRLAVMLAHLLAGRRRLADRAAQDRAHDRARPDRAAGDHVRPSVPDHGPRPPGRSVPAELARGRSAQAPRRGQGLQADRAGAPALDEHGRTHLHNIYGKLGAVDRAQAVLMATRARLAVGPRGPRRVSSRPCR